MIIIKKIHGKFAWNNNDIEKYVRKTCEELEVRPISIINLINEFSSPNDVDTVIELQRLSKNMHKNPLSIKETDKSFNDYLKIIKLIVELFEISPTGYKKIVTIFYKEPITSSPDGILQNITKYYEISKTKISDEILTLMFTSGKDIQLTTLSEMYVWATEYNVIPQAFVHFLKNYKVSTSNIYIK